jgi:hypothetical protein
MNSAQVLFQNLLSVSQSIISAYDIEDPEIMPAADQTVRKLSFP